MASSSVNNAAVQSRQSSDDTERGTVFFGRDTFTLATTGRDGDPVPSRTDAAARAAGHR